MLLFSIFSRMLHFAAPRPPLTVTPLLGFVRFKPENKSENTAAKIES